MHAKSTSLLQRREMTRFRQCPVWVQINVMIGYCSGTGQRKATPDREVIAIPEEYAAGPEYGMAIMSFDKPATVALAFAILSPDGQAVLKRFGFSPVGLRQKP